MKELEAKMLLLVIIVLMVAPSLSEMTGELASNSQSPCKPSRLLIIWETSSGGESSSHIQQMRLIIALINNLTDGTEILLTSVGTSLKHLIHFNKTSTDTSWRGIISLHKPENLTNYSIRYSSISAAVYTFLNQFRSQKLAEEIFFVVNNKSVIDNIGKVKEVLKYKIVFVVFAGTSRVPEVWTNVATDIQHLFVFSDRVTESIKPITEGILILYCEDSRLICDTDEYWTGERCYKCSYICSTDTKNPSGKCLEDCPYFTSWHYAKGVEAQHVTRNQTILNTAQTPSLICIVLTVMIIFYLVYIRCCRKKPIRKRYGTTLREFQSLTEEEGDTNAASDQRVILLSDENVSLLDEYNSLDQTESTV